MLAFPVHPVPIGVSTFWLLTAHLPGPTKSSCGRATKHEPCTSEGKVELQERFVGWWRQSLPAGMGQSRCGVTCSSHAA